jgi:hypothetical protein
MAGQIQQITPGFQAFGLDAQEAWRFVAAGIHQIAMRLALDGFNRDQPGLMGQIHDQLLGYQ